jgi:hypothetical protein
MQYTSNDVKLSIGRQYHLRPKEIHGWILKSFDETYAIIENYKTGRNRKVRLEKLKPTNRHKTK